MTSFNNKSKIGKNRISVEVLKEILPVSNMEEVRRISLKIREDAEQYNPNELTEMLIMISDRLIALCSVK